MVVDCGSLHLHDVWILRVLNVSSRTAFIFIFGFLSVKHLCYVLFQDLNVTPVSFLILLQGLDLRIFFVKLKLCLLRYHLHCLVCFVYLILVSLPLFLKIFYFLFELVLSLLLLLLHFLHFCFVLLLAFLELVIQGRDGLFEATHQIRIFKLLRLNRITSVLYLLF